MWSIRMLRLTVLTLWGILIIATCESCWVQEEPDTKTNANHIATDRYGDPLPAGAVARLGTVRLRKRGAFAQCYFSSDGHVMATTPSRSLLGGISCMYLWDLKTGRLIRTVRSTKTSDNALFHSIAFMPDDKCLISADATGRVIAFWEVQSGKELRRLTVDSRGDEDSTLNTIALSSDGRMLACGLTGGAITVIDLESKKQMLKSLGTKDRDDIESLAFTADGMFLASLDARNHVSLMDVRTGKTHSHFKIEQSTRVILAPDARHVAAITLREDRTSWALNQWDVASGKKKRLFEGSTRDFWDELCYSNDGKMLVGIEQSKGLVEFRNVAAGRLIRSFNISIKEFLTGIVLSPDQKILVCYGDDASYLGLWDTVNRKPILDFPGDTYPPSDLNWSADGKRLAAGPGDLFIWDVTQQTLINRFALSRDLRRDLFLKFRFSPRYDRAAGADEDKLVILDIGTKRRITEIHGQNQQRSTFNFSPSGEYLATTGLDGIVNVWEANSGKRIIRIDTRAQSTRVSWLLYTPDGKTLATGDGPLTVHLWDLASGRHLVKMEGNKQRQRERFTDERWQCCFTHDGQTLFVSSSSQLVVWDFRNRREIDFFCENENPEWRHIGTTPVSVSADDRIVAWVGSTNKLRLWERASGRLVYSFNDVYSDFAFAPEIQLLATGCDSDGSILIWDLVNLFLREQRHADGEKPRSIEQALEDLAKPDARCAYQAIGLLASNESEALAVFDKHLYPVPEAKAKEITAWLKDLDNVDFSVRENATRCLKDLRESARPFLERVLVGSPTAESRRRIQSLLDLLDPLSGDSLRDVRSVQVLEYLGTPEAIRRLRRLEEGYSEARLTKEAKAALTRLKQRADRPLK